MILVGAVFVLLITIPITPVPEAIETLRDRALWWVRQ